ncbi:MAG TPA: NAD(P)-binding domain-containing protein [Kofleriaceae bacterium]|nr:NAD(P)-binding domain-containing protein [Kofleriaceae bacterium]
MTWVVPLALGGLAILVMVTFTMLSARKRHRAVIAPAQVVGPRILVHDINDDRCTGCDACVAVCPTNVLDLVANKSRVLRFQDCIQCEACMFACPTEALVMFPEGATPPPLKIPEIDENFQTAVPGQYLIGEVAGKPLVKNAANLGRAVIEHMLTTGVYPGALGGGAVDVAIIGSGPGGLSAALTCIQKGLSYVVLDKEQMIASTIARYPKGKLVMAEPYDTENLSLLPVFDSSKEQLIPIWNELIERVRLQIKLGESVETVKRGAQGFEVRTTVATYQAQRVVLSIGTRGKPRTLQVPGENLPKVFSLLEDPDEWQGRNVLVVGGGDSACEAALALADSGAKVTISYRGRGFNRAAPKNKQSIERYAAEGRIKAKLGSQVLEFDQDTVTLALADNSQKRYPNDAAFVLIGADPPVAWLEKVGVRFVERPHQFQFGKSDDIVRRFVARAMECPEDAARAAAQVLGGSTGVEPSRAAAAISLPMPMGGEKVSGPKKWLRSATSIFSTRGASQMTPLPQKAPVSTQAGRGKKLDGPMPLSEFAKRQKTSHSHHHTHTGHGRRDQLTAGERTRILRMLRDEGGRLADEESQVHIGAAPPMPANYDFDFDDEGAQVAAPPAPSVRPDVPAKPALVVGLEKARKKRQTGGPQPAQPQPPRVPPAPSQPPPMRAKPATAPPPLPLRAVSPPPPPVLPARSKPASMPPPARAPRVNDPSEPAPARSNPSPRRGLPTPFSADAPRSSLFDEPTRLGDVDAHLLDQTRPKQSAPDAEYPPKFLPATTELAPPMHFDEDEATRLASPDGKLPPRRQPPPPRGQAPAPRGTAKHGDNERTRAVDIRNDPSINDIDWDID